MIASISQTAIRRYLYGLRSRSWSGSQYQLRFALAVLLLAGCSATKDQNQPKNIIDQPTGAEEEQLITAMDSFDRAIYTVAESQWTQFRDAFPASLYIPLAEIKIADSQFLRGEYQTAIISYEEFKRLHPGHEAVPYTVFQVGNAHLEQYEGVRRDQAPLQNAIRSYESLLASFPSSEYAILARRSLSRCRELLAEHEAYVADFYAARGDTVAAEVRRNTLLTLYPDSRVAGTLRPDEKQTAATPPGKNREQLVLNSPALVLDHQSRAPQPRVFRASEVSFDSASAAAKIETISAKERAVSWVECGVSDGEPIFILYSRYPITGETRDLTDSSKLQLQFDPDSEPQESAEGETNCESEGISIAVLSSEKSAEIKFAGLDGGHPKLFKLTRPTRAVITVTR